VCETPDAPGRRGWTGWPELAPPRASRPLGDWIDLTHPLSPDAPRLESFAPPVVTRIAELPADPLNVTRLEMVVHTGTHVDSPRHFVADGPAMEAIPLERLMGRGVVIRVDQPCDGVIEPDALERAPSPVEPGDIVVLACGWSERWGSPDWDRHPSLSLAAARWLVERRVKLLALDTPTPELPLERRPAGFDWPVHRLLLGSGVLICESLADPSALAGHRAELVFGALPISGSDGAPARVIGRRIAA
jgi:arylformamidase